jgi:hypothetical protein
MKGLVFHTNTELFFSKLIDKAVYNQALNISEEIKFYLLSLLSKNATSPNLIKQGNTGLYNNRPLSLIYLEALNEQLVIKKKMLKFVGDYTLYISGYFGDSFNGKIVDPKYYVVLGSNAFGNLAKLSQNSSNAELYIDIFQTFSDLVDILTEVSFDTMTSSSEDLMKLYDRWTRTKSKVLERKLIEKGIITHQGISIS